MILMAVMACVGEDNVRPKLPCESFKRVLDLAKLIRKVSVPETMKARGTQCGAANESAGAAFCFFRPIARRAPHNPTKLRPWTSPRQMHQRRAAADFYVVRMSAKTQHLEATAGAGQAQLYQFSLADCAAVTSSPGRRQERSARTPC